MFIYSLPANLFWENIEICLYLSSRVDAEVAQIVDIFLHDAQNQRLVLANPGSTVTVGLTFFLLEYSRFNTRRIEKLQSSFTDFSLIPKFMYITSIKNDRNHVYRIWYYNLLYLDKETQSTWY